MSVYFRVDFQAQKYFKFSIFSYLPGSFEVYIYTSTVKQFLLLLFQILKIDETPPLNKLKKTISYFFRFDPPPPLFKPASGGPA